MDHPLKHKETMFIIDNRTNLINILADGDLYIELAYELIGIKLHTSNDHLHMGVLTRGRKYAKYQYINYLLELLLGALQNCFRTEDINTLFKCLSCVSKRSDGKRVYPVETCYIEW